MLESSNFLPYLVEFDDLDELLTGYDFSLPDIAIVQPPLSPPHPTVHPASQQQHQKRSRLPVWLATDSPPTTKPRRKITSKWRKHEIEQLRRQVNELSNQLVQITPRSNPAKGTAGYLWMGLAQRQEHDRRRAEGENTRLREELASLDKYIRGFRRVLRKAESWKKKHGALISRDWMLLDPTCGDRGIVSLLVKNVDARLSTWPGVEESYWNGNHGDQCFGEVRRDSDGGYFFETVRARVLPFSPEIVEKVTWRSMCKGGSHVLFQVSEVTDNALISTLNIQSSCLEGLVEPEIFNIKTHLVLRRCVKNGRTVSVWEAVSLVPELKVLGTPALRWIQQGWVTSWAHQLRNGDEGCAVWASARGAISTQGNTTKGLGEQGLLLLQALARTLEDNGKLMEKDTESLMILDAAKKRQHKT